MMACRPCPKPCHFPYRHCCHSTSRDARTLEGQLFRFQACSTCCCCCFMQLEERTGFWYILPRRRVSCCRRRKMFSLDRSMNPDQQLRSLVIFGVGFGWSQRSVVTDLSVGGVDGLVSFGHVSILSHMPQDCQQDLIPAAPAKGRRIFFLFYGRPSEIPFQRWLSCFYYCTKCKGTFDNGPV